MFRVLVFGALFGLVLWLGAVGTGVAVAVLSQGNVHELSLLVSFANAAAPFLGGFAAGWLVKKRGWVHGGWVGALYTLMAALAAAIAFEGLFIFNFYSLLLNFCLGCVGGICGVNTGLCFAKSKGGRKRETGL